MKQLETKLEQTKSKEKTELVQVKQNHKKLEVQVREFKSKLQCQENLHLRKDKEIEQLKTQIEKRQASDEKYSIRDRQTFENHFGHKARPAEEKYVQFKLA